MPHLPRTPLTSQEISWLLILLLAGALVSAQLFWPPVLGLANNGDFERLMHWGKLEYLTTDRQERYFNWINREFHIAISPWLAWWGLASSEALFVKSSVLLSSVLRGGDRFDLRWLGGVHLAAFLAALWLLLKGWQRSSGLPGLALLPGFLLLFCDLGYTAYFHSLYSEPASLIFLLATTGAGLCLAGGAQVAPRALATFGGCALCLVTAKAQNVSLALPLWLFAARLYGRERVASNRKLIGAFAALLLLAVVLSLALTTRTMREANLYHSVFKGILSNSPTAAQDLLELGVPPQYAILAGSTIFDPNPLVDLKSAEFRAAFFDRLNPLHVARFYLTHPTRLWARLKTATERGYTLRAPGLGNFEKNSGAHAGAQARRWSWWSAFKQQHAPKSLWFLLCYWAMLGLVIFGWRPMPTLTREFCGALWLMLPLALATPLLGEGEADLEKHLFLFNACFDLTLLLLTSWFLGWLYRRVFTGGFDNR